ncbi:response regulator [Hymenobacter sp. YC55]|uniref:response regulator n=1 Tax=Hymenobacter sp. YC55 TaxID=3034019 RepID=UPI0023F75D2A|nr:response regulator [Hymenobacter sp. YC55]MDF7815927.1 response regulator [Hymenobacter sp. YC55]
MPALTSVLLVDDDPTTNYLNTLLLTRMGVTEQVLVAENGEQALRTLVQTCTADKTSCPRLILLDMNMPVLNGLAFLETYVQLPLAQQQAIVIVLLTSSLHPVDLARAQQLPIAGFLNKPLTKEKVTALLQQHFPVAE